MGHRGGRPCRAQRRHRRRLLYVCRLRGRGLGPRAGPSFASASLGGILVIPSSPPQLPPAAAAVCIFAMFLIPFALAGVALINCGLSRSHSAAHALVASLCAVAVATVAYFVCGAAWIGSVGAPGYTIF